MLRHLSRLLITLTILGATYAVHAADADEIKRLAAENAALKAQVAELQKQLGKPAAGTEGKVAPTEDKDPSAAQLRDLRARRDTLNAGLFGVLQQLNAKLVAIPTSGGTTVKNDENFAKADAIISAAKLDNFRMAVVARLADVKPGSGGTVEIKITDVEPLVPFADAQPAISFNAIPGYYRGSTRVGYEVLMTAAEAKLLQVGQPILIIIKQTIWEYSTSGNLRSHSEPIFASLKFPRRAAGELRAGDYVLQIGDRLYDSPLRHVNTLQPTK